MLRKITLSLFLVAGITYPATAQPADVAAEDLAFTEAVRNYHEHLALRSDPYVHAEMVRDILNAFDGRVVVEGFLDDGGFYMMVWDAGLENVVVFRDGEEILLERYTDEYGRPAFEANLMENGISGWIDVWEDELHLLITRDGNGHRWLRDNSNRSNDHLVPLIESAARICKCGPGGKSNCPSEDCDKGKSCTQPNGRQAQCVWQTHVRGEDPTRCLATEADGVVMLSGMGLVTFCGPVRRRVVRRVCRSR